MAQTIALLHWFRRLRTCWEIRGDIHEAFHLDVQPLVARSLLTCYRWLQVRCVSEK